MRFLKAQSVEIPTGLEVEFDESSGEPDRVVLWIDGTGYDITNAARIQDSHGRTVWDDPHVRQVRTHPKLTQNPMETVEGHD